MFRVSMRAPQRKGFVSGLALALALTAATGVSAPAYAQSDAPQYSKDFAKAANKASTDINAARAKPEVAAELNNLLAASNALSAAKGDAVAPAQAQFNATAQRIQGMVGSEREQLKALAASAKAPDEKYLAGDLMTFLGTFTGDRALRADGLKLKLESGALKPGAIATSWFELGQLYFVNNRIDESRMAYEAAYKAGNLDGAIYAADIYYTSNRVTEGLDYLEGLIMARTVAGLDVPQEWYGNGLSHARDLGDAARIGHWAGLYAARGNSPKTWNAGISVLLGTTKLGLQEQLDAYRLMKRTDALLSATDYVRYIEAADARSMANEVLPAVNEAVSKGLLSQEPTGAVSATLADFTKKNIEIAEKRAVEDRSTIDQIVADARKAPTGEDARDAGDVYQSFGEAAKAEEMFQLALSKGGVDADRINTRLAIAQVDQGKYAEARATFAKVSGVRAPLAAMWLAYIDTKAGRTS